MTSSFRIFALCALLCLTMSGCGVYRMPGEDDLAHIPTTNNPDVIDEKAPLAMPGFAI